MSNELPIPEQVGKWNIEFVNHISKLEFNNLYINIRDNYNLSVPSGFINSDSPKFVDFILGCTFLKGKGIDISFLTKEFNRKVSVPGNLVHTYSLASLTASYVFNGYDVKFLHEKKNIKNPDFSIDGKVACVFR